MKQTIVLLCLSLFTTELYAWGAIGHRIVGKIAEDNLSPKAKESIAALLPGQSLADVSTWADMIRSDPAWAKAKPWHFLDIADGVTYDTTTPVPEGDVISAITSMVNTLKDVNSSLLDKQNALKFIIHFVGDIHQPLHAGRPGDRGGNSVKVNFIGRSMNLHSVWDSGMIDYQKLGFAEYAAKLEAQSEGRNANYNLAEISFSQILKEDMEVRKDIYNFQIPSGTKPVTLTEAYMKANIATHDRGLLLGGKRLAFLLNSLYK
ncbi:MAG: S1/P1 nuclease [Bacteriovoracaceae bacterium]